MFSQATSDGALTLTITFALGTDLDNAQVQVQNRVAQALPRLPQEVQRIGVTTEKASPDFIMVVHLVSPDERYDMLYLSNYAHLQVKDELSRIDGVGSVQVFGAGEYSMRVWLDPDRLAVAPAHGHRRRARDPRAERAGRGRRARRAAGADRYHVPAVDQHAGPPVHRRGVRRHRRARDAATARSRGCATSAASSSARTATRCAACSTTSRPWRSASSSVRAPTRSRPRPTCARRWRRLKQTSRTGVDYRIVYDPTVFVRESIHAVVVDAVRGHPAGRDRRGGVPADLARVDHPARRRAGLADRHVRGDAGARLLAEHALALRPGARHRHRRRRCDRRGGERGAAHRAGADADGGDATRRWRRCRGRSSPSRWCCARCSCRRRSSAA